MHWSAHHHAAEPCIVTQVDFRAEGAAAGVVTAPLVGAHHGVQALRPARLPWALAPHRARLEAVIAKCQHMINKQTSRHL
jgi:hypothetical protein